MAAIDYLLIGHVTKDLTPEGPKLGGTVSYSARIAQAFGLKVGVVTSAREGEPLLRALELSGAALACRPAEHTTTFTNTYHGGQRRQILNARAAPLSIEDVPAGWRRADIVHLGPLTAEIDPAAAAHFPGAFLGVTPQGWLRAWDRAGAVRAAVWDEADDVLPHAAAVVISPEDLQYDKAQIARYIRLAPLLVITHERYGADLYVGGKRHYFPTHPVEVVDPTGAGDTFAAVFFIWLHRHPDDPIGATRLANYLATESVARAGLAATPTPEEIHAAVERLGLG